MQAAVIRGADLHRLRFRAALAGISAMPVVLTIAMLPVGAQAGVIKPQVVTPNLVTPHVVSPPAPSPTPPAGRAPASSSASADGPPPAVSPPPVASPPPASPAPANPPFPDPPEDPPYWHPECDEICKLGWKNYYTEWRLKSLYYFPETAHTPEELKTAKLIAATVNAIDGEIKLEKERANEAAIRLSNREQNLIDRMKIDAAPDAISGGMLDEEPMPSGPLSEDPVGIACPIFQNDFESALNDVHEGAKCF